MEVNCISDQGPGCTATYWGNVKLTAYSRVQVLHCYKLLSRDEREETWFVGLLQNESLDSMAMRRNLDSRVTSK